MCDGLTKCNGMFKREGLTDSVGSTAVGRILRHLTHSDVGFKAYDINNIFVLKK